MSNEVDLGLRLFLNDMLSSGLNALRGTMSNLSSGIEQSRAAAENYSAQIDRMIGTSVGLTDENIALRDALDLNRVQYGLNVQAISDLDAEYEVMVERQIEITAELEALSASTNGFTTMTQAEKEQVNLLSQEFSTNNRFMSQNEAEANKLAAAAQRQQGAISSLQTQINANSQAQLSNQNATMQAQSAMEAAAAEADTLAMALTGVGVAVGSGIDLLGFASAIGFSVKAAASLQDAMAGVQITLNATDKDMEQLQAVITQVAENSIFSSAQVADAFSMLGDKGFNATEIMSGLGQQSINLAEAIKSDAAPAADLLASTMQAFGAKASEAKQYADALAFAFHNGMPSVSELSTAMNNLGAQVREAGIPIGELMPVLDYLTQSGMDASTAASSLRYMIQALQSPTAAATKAMADLGLITINQVNPAFLSFMSRLDAVDKAQHHIAPTFNGTYQSLLDIYNAAQKTGTISTDQSFLQWAQSLGILNDKMFNANGSFKDFNDILKMIGDKLKGLTDEQKSQVLNSLFNVRSGQGAKLLFSDFDTASQKIDDLVKKFQNFSGQGGVLKAAYDRADTLNGEVKKLGTTFQTMGANMAGSLNPMAGFVGNINSLLSTTNGKTSQITQFGQAFMGIGATLSAIGVIVGVTIGVIALAATGVGEVLLIIVGVAAGIVALSAGLAGLVVWLQNVMKDGANPLSWVFRDLGINMQQFGGMMNSAVGPALNDFKDIWSQIQPAIGPTIIGLKVVGGIIGGVLIAAIGGLMTAMGPLINGIGKILAGAIQMVINSFMLFFNLIKALGLVLAGLFLLITGHGTQAAQVFGAAGKTMMDAWGNVVGFFRGLWNIILGIFQAVIGTIVGFIWGFVGAIVSFFQHMADTLVNHSIIPDMLKSILNWFLWLPTQVIGAIVHLVETIISNAQGLWGKFKASVLDPLGSGVKNFLAGALSWGESMMHMFVQGIQNGVGWVMNAINNLINSIKAKLGFASPPKEGALSDSDKYMPNMMRMFAGGIDANAHLVTGSVGRVANAMAGTFSHPNSLAFAGGGSFGGGAGGTTVIPLVVDGKVLTQVVLDHSTNTLKLNGMGRSLK